MLLPLFAEAGAERVANLTVPEILVLSIMAGGFITVGAVLATLIATGKTNEGLKRLLEGVGFSVGFFTVLLSGALLFTEANVELPATLLSRDGRTILSRLARRWLLAGVGNLIGAVLVGWAITTAQSFTPGVEALLAEIVASKMRYQSIDGAAGWWQAVLSGVMGNWLVGMAAFLAVMGRTIVGKFIPVLLLVTAFVAAGFLHSPANMAFFSLAEPLSLGPGWAAALAWGIAPAALGNVIGALLLVALPLWFVDPRRSADRLDAATVE